MTWKQRSVYHLAIYLFALPIGVYVFSLAFRTAYVTALLAALILSTLGHLLTLDDDFPGGWSNQEGSMKRRNWSIAGLLVKAAFALVLFWLIGAYPELKNYGA